MRNRINNNNFKKADNRGTSKKMGSIKKKDEVKKRLGLATQKGSANGNKKVNPVIKPNDIRFKLIAKKRKNISDARDRIVELKKPTDARMTLNSIKKATNGASNQGQQHSRNEIGPNARKPVSKISNKQAQALVKRAGLQTRMKSGALIRTVNGKQNIIRKTVKNGKFSLVSRRSANDRYHPLKNNPNVVTIKNDKLQRTANRSSKASSASKSKRSVGSSQRRPQQQPEPMYAERRYDGPTYTPIPIPVYAGMTHSYPTHNQMWSPPPLMAASMPARHEMPPMYPKQLRITTENNMMGSYDRPPMRYEDEIMDSRFMPARLPQKRSYYDRYEEERMMSPPQPKRLMPSNDRYESSDVMTRLDERQRTFQPQAGHKVIVSNLHNVVTLDDVEELFGNIGSIKYANILYDGAAEVIFAKEDDAFRSVEVYHNRQLDGQPMNVRMVDKKDTLRSPSPPPMRPQRYISPPRQRRPAPVRSQPKSVLRSAGMNKMLTTRYRIYED